LGYQDFRHRFIIGVEEGWRFGIDFSQHLEISGFFERVLDLFWVWGKFGIFFNRFELGGM
jgi:hypothetical protein